MAKAVKEALSELGRMRVGDWNVIISSNIPLRRDGLPRANCPRVQDAGVAVYFRLKDEARVLACDKWDRPEHNLWAIAKHIAAMRGMDRWGVGSLDQAFQGYKALPETGSKDRALGVLGLTTMPTKVAVIQDAFRQKSKEVHPDRGGNAELFQDLVKCKDQLLDQLQGRTT